MVYVLLDSGIIIIWLISISWIQSQSHHIKQLTLYFYIIYNT